MTEPHNIQVGDRVRVARGTFIEGLDGVVALLHPSINRPDVIRALVWLDFPEPGIGKQMEVDVDDLDLL